MKYKIKKNINKYIFRGYDVRGIYKEELDDDSAYILFCSNIFKYICRN